MKYWLMLPLSLLLTGCYSSSCGGFWKNHEVLYKRAESYCKDKGGVYMWGYGSEKGRVQCYDLTTYSTFRQEVVDES